MLVTLTNRSAELTANRQTLQKPKLTTRIEITLQYQRPAPSMRAVEPKLLENIASCNSCCKLVIHDIHVNLLHLSVTAARDLKVQCTTIALAQVPCPSHGLQLLQPLPDAA